MQFPRGEEEKGTSRSDKGNIKCAAGWQGKKCKYVLCGAALVSQRAYDLHKNVSLPLPYSQPIHSYKLLLDHGMEKLIDN